MGRSRPRRTVVSEDDQSSSSAAAAVVALPPTGSLDLFAKFQSHRGDFQADWILMEEDALPETAPLKEELLDKLRAHQGTIATRRDGEDDERETSSRSRSRSRRSNNDDEEEYDPEAVVAKTATEQLAEEEHAERQRRKQERKDKSDTELQMDFLNFIKHKEVELTAADLQVALPEEKRSGRDPPHRHTSSWQSHSQQSPASNLGGSQTAEALLSAVPLWSAKRVQEWGGYIDPEEYPTIALHQEIMDFIDFLRPSQAEVSLRRFIELEISRMSKKLWPESEVVVYGSLHTHLLLPLSDIDITIANVPLPSEEALPLLAKEIDAERFTDGGYPQVILKTKVPLVKFKHARSLIDVDISIDALDGKENTRIVVELLNTFPEARPLILLIKYFLQQREMDEPYRGGLGSYSTTLMVISFLQHHPIYTTKPKERPFTGLGKLLVDFFRYYGMYWNFNRCGISLREGGRYYQRSVSSPTSSRSPSGQPTQAEILDPGNPENNAASSLRQFHVISSFFSHAYCALTANEMPIPVPSRSHKPISPDSQDIAQRPTLLSRILHVDPESVRQRRCIEATYERLCQLAPERMEEVRAYRREEDLPLMTGNPCAVPRRLRSSVSTSASATTTPTFQKTRTSGVGLALERLRAAAAGGGGAAVTLAPSSEMSTSHLPPEMLGVRSGSSDSSSSDNVKRRGGNGRRDGRENEPKRSSKRHREASPASLNSSPRRPTANHRGGHSRPPRNGFEAGSGSSFSSSSHADSVPRDMRSKHR